MHTLFKSIPTLILLVPLSGCVDGVLFGPPVIDLLTIMPAPPRAGDTLKCQYTGYAGGPDASTFEWAVNDEFVGDQQTLTGGFITGDEVSCTVTPSNGNRDGELRTISATILNGLASIANVSITPDPAISADKLTCSHDDAIDADGTTEFSYTYRWTVDGETINANNETLNANKVERDTTVQCHVVANDGEEDGPEQSSQQVLIANSPPVIPAIIIDPFAPSEDDTLTCDYTSFDDADDDDDLSTYQWDINGVDAGTSAVLISGFQNGDTVTCTVLPFDGYDEGEPVSGSVLIADPVDCSTTGDGYWVASWASYECEVLDETNYRRSLGADCGTYGSFPPAGPLTMNPNLRYAARIHSEWMSDTDSFSHDSPGGPIGDDMTERIETAGYTPWSALGENIAAGYSTPVDALNGWMSSDGHCKNIMNANFDEIGVGYFYDSSSSYTHWWTQDFGRQ